MVNNLLVFFPFFWLTLQVVRGLWNRSDVVVGTDCGAIDNMINQNHYAKNGEDAASKAINSGADLELGANHTDKHIDSLCFFVFLRHTNTLIL